MSVCVIIPDEKPGCMELYNQLKRSWLNQSAICAKQENEGDRMYHTVHTLLHIPIYLCHIGLICLALQCDETSVSVYANSDFYL